MARLARGWIVALLGAASSGCSSEPAAAPGGDETALSAVADARAPGPMATPEWEREITPQTGYPIRPIAFRAGGGVVSLLHGPRLASLVFALVDSGRGGGAGGPIPRSFNMSGGPPLQMASDIAGVSSDSRTWFLDPRTGRIIDEDVGLYSALVASLGARGTIRTACALGEHAIAYLDVARPDTVLVRDLTSPAPPRALSLPANFAALHQVPWDSLRFGGSPDGPCVVSSPQLRGLLVVSDSAVRAIDGFVEPAAAKARREAWYAPLARLVSRSTASDADSAATLGVLDATSFPGGVAVLFAGRTAEAGRLVDFYATSGAYLTTLRLPHRALRIAASHGRLYVLRQRQRQDPYDEIAGHAYLASYLLPARVRAGRVLTDEPTVIAPPPPGRGPAPTADSTAR